MEHLSEIIFAVVFLLFSVFAFVRRTVEGRDVEKRNQESEWTADDLPEETRRMLFGDKAPPAAKPARPAQQRRSLDPFDEVRDVFNEMRRQIEVQTAKPRQGAPRPQPPPTLPPQAP
ncbi:MAG: hypothetical protein HUU46_20830, partial [Candidatus Hydrogenedentes bacterium]|nr:hypothetical protein [Candidatus Hydrogenedentota bacterium]